MNLQELLMFIGQLNALEKFQLWELNLYELTRITYVYVSKYMQIILAS